MRTIRSQEIFTKKFRQRQNFDSDPKEAWHYNYVTFTPISKNFMPYCRLIYMLSMLYVRLKIKVNVGIPERFKVGWYPHKIPGSSHLNYFSFKTESSDELQMSKSKVELCVRDGENFFGERSSPYSKVTFPSHKTF